MKIAIDCRYYGKSGIGRYLRGVLEHIDFESDDYFLIGDKNLLGNLPYRFKLIETSISPFNVKSLVKFPIKEVNKCDVLYSPNFILPYGIKIRVFTTIHDVIFLDYKNSNKGKIDYLIKRYFIKRALKMSEKVFTVSHFTEGRIGYFFSKYKEKIIVTGSAIAEQLKVYPISQEKINHSLVYVGNIKKHKGLSVLNAAMDILNKEKYKYHLTVIGKRDEFRTADKNNDILTRNDVKFTGYLSENDLVKEISQAEFLIQPSFYEGFGLTPLEAMYFGTRPIISDIDPHKEIYSQFSDVIFFKTGDAKKLAEAITENEGIITTKREEIDTVYSFEKYTKSIINTIKEMVYDNY